MNLAALAVIVAIWRINPQSVDTGIGSGYDPTSIEESTAHVRRCWMQGCAALASGGKHSRTAALDEVRRQMNGKERGTVTQRRRQRDIERNEGSDRVEQRLIQPMCIRWRKSENNNHG